MKFKDAILSHVLSRTSVVCMPYANSTLRSFSKEVIEHFSDKKAYSFCDKVTSLRKDTVMAIFQTKNKAS